jgi:hypothetical protein
MKGKLCLLFINIRFLSPLRRKNAKYPPNKPYMGANEIPCMILSQGLIDVVQRSLKEVDAKLYYFTCLEAGSW